MSMVSELLPGVFPITFDAGTVPVLSFGIWSIRLGWFSFEAAGYEDVAFDRAKHARAVVAHPDFAHIKVVIVPAAAASPPFSVIPFVADGSGLKAAQPLDYGVEGVPWIPPASWTVEPK
jgi:hypothetical protein